MLHVDRCPADADGGTGRQAEGAGADIRGTRRAGRRRTRAALAVAATLPSAVSTAATVSAATAVTAAATVSTATAVSAAATVSTAAAVSATAAVTAAASSSAFRVRRHTARIKRACERKSLDRTSDYQRNHDERQKLSSHGHLQPPRARIDQPGVPAIAVRWTSYKAMLGSMAPMRIRTEKQLDVPFPRVRAFGNGMSPPARFANWAGGLACAGQGRDAQDLVQLFETLGRYPS